MKPSKPKGNPVAKFMHKYNKARVFKNKKLDYSRKMRDNTQYKKEEE